MPMPVFGAGPTPLIKFKLSGPAAALRWKLYTRALVVVDATEAAQTMQAGWNQSALKLPTDLASDLYYLELSALRGTVTSPRKMVKLMVIR